jgi:hypothetical protein
MAPYARMDCYLPDSLRCSGRNASRVIIRTVIMDEWRTIPLYTKTPLPFAPLGSLSTLFSLFELLLASFTSLALLQGRCGCRRFLRQPLPSVSPKHRRNRAWLVPQFENLPCYFLLPALTRISTIHTNVDMLSTCDHSHTLENTFNWPG